VGRPPLLFADEPTASLDAHSGAEVMKLMTALARSAGPPWSWSPTTTASTRTPTAVIAIEDGRLLKESP
jgi:putative ABC transport system ATP-binding protein